MNERQGEHSTHAGSKRLHSQARARTECSMQVHQVTHVGGRNPRVSSRPVPSRAHQQKLGGKQSSRHQSQHSHRAGTRSSFMGCAQCPHQTYFREGFLVMSKSFTRGVISVPASPLLIQFPGNRPQKAAGESSRRWPSTGDP